MFSNISKDDKMMTAQTFLKFPLKKGIYTARGGGGRGMGGGVVEGEGVDGGVVGRE